MIPRRSTRDAVYLKKKKKEKKILRIKRSRLEPGDGERALIKESFPAPPPFLLFSTYRGNYVARVNLSLPLPLLAKVTTTSLLFPPKKSSHDLASRSIVYFHVYASCLPFLGPSLPLLPSSQNFISWRDVSVSMPSRSRERSNFSDSPLRGGRRGIETNVSKDKRRVKDPRPRLI